MKPIQSLVILLACAGACAATQAVAAEPTIATMNCVGDTATQLSLADYQIDLGDYASASSQSSGAGAGKVTFLPVIVDTVVDQHLPQLVTQLTEGRLWSRCTIQFGGDSGFSVILGSVLISNIKLVSEDQDTVGGGPEGIARPRASVIARISLEFAKLRIAYTGGRAGNIAP